MTLGDLMSNEVSERLNCIRNIFQIICDICVTMGSYGLALWCIICYFKLQNMFFFSKLGGIGKSFLLSGEGELKLVLTSKATNRTRKTHFLPNSALCMPLL